MSDKRLNNHLQNIYNDYINDYLSLISLKFVDI
jgi:hypothetical protein